MRAGLRLRMQRHHVGVAVHRVQHSGAQAGRAFCAAAPGPRAARCRPQGASTQATSSASANTSAAAGIQ